jgi:glycosyltransferase involved in cell wall biosynthesis
MGLKVLMFGWEFPPVYSGGLGIACEGLVKGLCHKNVEVTFVMPQGPEEVKSDYAKIIVASQLPGYKINIKPVPSLLRAYISEDQYSVDYHKYVEKLAAKKQGIKPLYGRDIYEETYRFSQIAKLIALSEEFDIIHCHDWMTYQAGIEAKNVSGKPLVVHIHNTVFDRGGDNGNQYEYDIEKKGFEAADRIIAVSNFIKNKLLTRYGIDEKKIAVVYNGVEVKGEPLAKISESEKVVLFYGRLTLQKGPDYFVEAAKKISDFDPNVRFIIAGTGDMEARLISRVAELGLGKKVLFTGFINQNEIPKIFQLADVFVMPSVSEPFGIIPLEAVYNNVPTIISKQSGVSEVLKNALKIDFWDIDEMASKIISLINYRALHHELKTHGAVEIKAFNWDTPAEKCVNVYNELLVCRH